MNQFACDETLVFKIRHYYERNNNTDKMEPRKLLLLEIQVLQTCGRYYITLQEHRIGVHWAQTSPSLNDCRRRVKCQTNEEVSFHWTNTSDKREVESSAHEHAWPRSHTHSAYVECANDTTTIDLSTPPKKWRRNWRIHNSSAALFFKG